MIRSASYVVRAILAHADLLAAVGIADGRPIRFDGLTPTEATEVRAALIDAHPSWRVHLLGADIDEPSGVINAERATRYRNEAAGSPEAQSFVLLAPLGVVVESSLNEPAFYVVARASVFREALAKLRVELRVTRADIESVRESSVHGDQEALFGFLGSWNRMEGSIETDAPMRYLGLLADSNLEATSVDALKAGLRRNFEAVEVLSRPGLSPARVVAELVQKLGASSALDTELTALRSWMTSGMSGPRPRLADFGEWDFVDPEGLRPKLQLTPNLAQAPHVGWSADDPVPSVDDPNGSSKIVWIIENRKPSVRVEVALVEEFSQGVVANLGKTSAQSKLIRWAHVFRSGDLEATLRELNPAGDVEGYFFRLRLRLLDGSTFLEDAETEPFRAVIPGGDVEVAAAPTAWHALYRFHTERAVSPRFGERGSEDPTAVALAEEGGRRREVKLDISPVLVEVEKRMLEFPRFAGSWTLNLDPASSIGPAGADLHRLVEGTRDEDYLDKREKFLASLGTFRLVETLDFQDPQTRAIAMSYVRSWESLADSLVDLGRAGPGIAAETKLRAARLSAVDTIRVEFPGDHEGDRHEILLVSPFHPAVVAWALGFDDMVQAWSRGPYDPALKPPYRAGPSGTAVLGGIEGFGVGPRTMLAFTAFENEALPTAWAFSGSVHPLWQAFVRISDDVGSRSRQWPEDLAQLLRLRGVPVGGNRIDARRVGSRLRKYAILHPYLRQLRIAALMAGDGQPLLDAMRVIDEKPGTPLGALSIRDIRLELQQIGPRSDRLGAAVEDLTSNPGDGRWRGYAAAVLDNPETVLSPGFAFAVHPVDAGSGGGSTFWPAVTKQLRSIQGGINTTVFGALLATNTSVVPAVSSSSSSTSQGLISRPATVVTSVGGNEAFAGDWTLVIPRPNRGAGPSASSQHLLLDLVDIAGGSVSPQFALGLNVALAGPVTEALRAAHDVSDWVIIADPLFSIELMDRAATPSGSVLLDYSPEFDAYPGGRVVVSTSMLGELRLLDAPNQGAGLASRSLIRVLSSISARLLLSLANPTKQVVRGLHGLALTRVFLQDYRPNAVVIPMDGHADMFAVPRVSGTHRLADLLAVSVFDGRLQLTVVESKWVGKANLGAKTGDGLAQARTSMDVLRAEFIDYAGVDRDLRIDALREIIFFHLDRAARHDLQPPFTRADVIAATMGDDTIRAAQVEACVVVWCPDIDSDDEWEDHGAHVVHHGEESIRRHAAMMGEWPAGTATKPAEEAEELDLLFEDLIESTTADDLAEREASETGTEPTGAPAFDDRWLEANASPEPGSVASDLGSPQGPTRADLPLNADEPADPQGTALLNYKAEVEARTEEPGDEGRASGSRGLIPIRLGHRVSTGEDVLWTPFALANGHMAVLGGSGAGKTTLLRKLSGCLTKIAVPVLILDFHGDLYLPDGEYSYDFSYDSNSSFINPLHLDPAYAAEISQSRLKWEFMEAWRSQYPSLGIQQRNYLTTLIEDAYRAAGVTNDPATWNTGIDFSDVLAAFEDSPASPAQKQRIDAYMKQFREWAVFHGGTAISVESMLLRSTRLNLSQLDGGARNIVADVVLRRLFLLAKALGPLPEGTKGWDRFRVFVVIDEAQVLLTSNADAKASLAKYASEARKFGIGLILATQLRDNIPGEVWGNIDTRLWMLALDQVERQKNARAANLPEQSIASLKVGEAFLVASSQPGTRPIHLKIDPVGC